MEKKYVDITKEGLIELVKQGHVFTSQGIVRFDRWYTEIILTEKIKMTQKILL